MLYSIAVTAGSNGAPVRNLNVWRAVAISTGLGTAFATAVVMGLLIGNFADERLGNTVPVLTILGSLLGLAAGVYSSAQLVQFALRRKE